ncbi:hydroxyacid dehydrogenase [Paenibacillus ginsengarvi]|uniref:Hydroxyacid dehydrogenase n=1 Tax=Paenibacillus ginsengarvi TaxID=400777 RepID=A0A3B0CKW1_9BACL|nr:hydroxyacid dehydrogenase [Paenibacillus ginsengarvi]RKN84977.1 hydroxyacid dehydrogenase [Paenibacillus ginsengarvi]
MRKPKIVQVLSMYHPKGEQLLLEGADVVRTDDYDVGCLCDTVREAEGIVLRAPARITKEVIDAAPRLRAISGAGVGLDNIDVAYATSKRIPVLHAPAVNAVSTAEHTVMLIMAAAKSLIPFHEQMRQGRFGSRMDIPTRELYGKTAGLVGFGTIAREVAKRLRFGLGMEVSAWTRTADDTKREAAQRLETELTTDLDELFHKSDFVSLHIPLNRHTRGLVNSRLLGLMKPDAWLINTARGAVVDQDNLVDALGRGQLAGAALDVFEPEPIPAEHPLLALQNVILTPHVAGTTQESNYIAATTVARNMLRVLAGERPEYIGNPEVWQ